MDVEKRVSISAQMNSAPFKQGAEEVAQAAANMTGRVSQASSQMGRSLLDNVGAFENLKRKFVEGYAEAQNYARAFQALSRAVAQGRDTFGLMPGILDAIERQYGLAGTKARDFAAAMMSAKKGSDEQQAALKGLVQVFQQLKQEETERIARQQAMTRAVGDVPFGPPTAQQDQQARQAAMTGPPGALQSWPKSREELDAMRASIDRVFAASKAYEAELNTINSVSKQLNLTQAQQDVLLDQLNQRYAASQQAAARTGNSLSSLTGTTHQQQFAFRQLGVQAIQTFQGFATGQPVMMTLIQQGHQVADVMIASGTGFRQLGTAFSNFLSALPAATGPLLFIAELIAGLATLAVQAETTARRLHTLQNSARGVRDDFGPMSQEAEQAAHHLAATTSISFADAFKATSVLTNTPEFQGNQAQMENLVKIAHNLSLTIGGDVETSMKLMAKSMQDAGSVAQSLMDEHHLKGVDQAWVDMVKDMQAHDPARAAEMVINAIDRATRGATDNMTNLQKAWNRLMDDFTGANGSINSLGQALNNLLAGILNGVAKVLELLEKIREYTPNLPEWLKGNFILGNTPQTAPAGAAKTLSLMPDYSGQYADLFKENEQRYGLPPGMLAGIAKIESNFDPTRVNQSSGAGGLMQILSSTAAKPGYGINPITDAQRFDPATAIRFAAQYLAATRESTGSWEGAVRQYSGGGYNLTSTSGVANLPGTAITRAQQGSTDTLEAQRAELQRRIDEQQRGLAVARERNDVPGIIRYEEEIRKLTSAMTNNISEQQKMARSSDDLLRPMRALPGAARDLAQEEEHFRQVARDTNGGIVDQTALSEALKNKQRELMFQLRDTIVEMDYQTNAQNALVTATEQGGAALDHAQNYEKAVIEAYKYGTVGSKEYAQAVTQLTEAYDRASEAKRKLAAAEMVHSLEQENEQLQLEASLIGASTAEINRQTAVLRARQQLGLHPGEQANEGQQRAIDQAARNADTRTQIEFTKQAYQEIEGVADHAFSSIGDAIVASFQEGADAAKIWKDAIGNILNDVIKEFMKLAILNPLMNALFGKTRPELGDLGGIFGGGSGSGSGGGAGDLLGGLGKLIGGGGGGSSDPVSTALNRGAGNPPGGGGGGGSMDIFGKGIDAIFGKGFYEGGGLIGSLFGGSSGGGADLPGLYHAGGVVGRDVVPIRWLDAAAFLNAPRYQTGLGNDEFAAILHRSERVLTANQNDRLEHVLGRVANGEPQRGGPNVVFNISTPDADSFRASQPQIHSRAVAAMNRTVQRNQTR